MTRVEAFIALFGGLPQDATQEHVDLVKDNLDPTDQEWEEMSDGMDSYIQHSLRTFKNEPEFFISNIESEQTRALLSSMVPKPAEQKQPDKPAENPPKVAVTPRETAKNKPKGTPVSSSNFSALFASTKPVRGVPVEKPRENKQQEIPACRQAGFDLTQDDKEEPKVLVPATKTIDPPVLTFPEDNKSERKKDPTTELTVLTVYKVFLPEFVVELLKQKDWHTARNRIENVVEQTKTKNVNDMLNAFKAFSGWKVYMTEYAQGCSGYEKCIFGAYMLECMQALESGMRPESDEYQCRYVTGNIASH